MPFIQLHSNSDMNKVMYNTEHIVKFYEPKEKTGCLIYTDDGHKKKVKESYEEVSNMIYKNNSFINIVDKTKPLTIDDLKNMSGEFVWDDKEKEWYLVWYYTTDEVYLAQPDGLYCWVDENQLKTNPLYKINIKQYIK